MNSVSHITMTDLSLIQKAISTTEMVMGKMDPFTIETGSTILQEDRTTDSKINFSMILTICLRATMKTSTTILSTKNFSRKEVALLKRTSRTTHTQRQSSSETWAALSTEKNSRNIWTRIGFFQILFSIQMRWCLEWRHMRRQRVS